MTAAPVVTADAHLDATGGRAAAVVLNSGNANAATGDAGPAPTPSRCAQLVAAELGLRGRARCSCAPPGSSASRCRSSAILRRHPRAGRPPAAPTAAPTRPRRSSPPTPSARRPSVAGGGFTVGGMAKGAAMLAPNMATMLAVLTTDADVEPADAAARRCGPAVADSFNRLVVDGCTSTNDTVHRPGQRARPARRPTPDAFDAAVADGVPRPRRRRWPATPRAPPRSCGSTCTGAASDDEARPGARSGRRQPAGASARGTASDPYWGRVASELGSAGHRVRPRPALASPTAASSVASGGVDRAATTRPRSPRTWPGATSRSPPTSASATGTRHGPHQRPHPRVHRREHGDVVTRRPTTPATAHEQGRRSWSRRCRTSSAFRGRDRRRQVRRQRDGRPGAGRRSFAEDVVLMRLGRACSPVVVHGGGPQISELMARLGKEPEFRRRPAGHRRRDVDIARMVLGRQGQPRDRRRPSTVHGPLAVGLSGEDAGLIVAAPRDARPRASSATSTDVEPDRSSSALLRRGAHPGHRRRSGSTTTGQAYNINADTVAGAIAEALGAEKLVYLTDVAGPARRRRRPDEPRSRRIDAAGARGARSTTARSPAG